MNLPVLVLGAGGHAKVLIEALLASSAVIAGILDPEPSLAGTSLLGVPVLGGDQIVADFSTSGILLVNGMGSVGLPIRRQRLYEHFRGKGYKFASVVHPSAIIASDAELNAGAQVMAGSIIQPGCRIGCNAIINTKASVDHDCLIGDHVHISPGVTLSGGVRIGAGCHLGTSATVIQGITIGMGSLVAAGAVVVSNVDSNTMVKGLPARTFQL